MIFMVSPFLPGLSPRLGGVYLRSMCLAGIPAGLVPRLFCAPFTNDYGFSLVGAIVGLIDVQPGIRKRAEKVQAVFDPDALIVLENALSTMHPQSVANLLHDAHFLPGYTARPG